LRRFALIFAFSVAGTPAAAGCMSDAQEKKLEGAALKTFMAKCRMDAITSCDADAKARNLSGLDKTNYTNKCLAQAVGP